MSWTIISKGAEIDKDWIVRFDDYRNFGGPLMATKITSRSGDHSQTFTYESVSCEALDDSIFELPPAVSPVQIAWLFASRCIPGAPQAIETRYSPRMWRSMRLARLHFLSERDQADVRSPDLLVPNSGSHFLRSLGFYANHRAVGSNGCPEKEHSATCRMLVNFSASVSSKSLRISRPIS